MTDKTTRRNKVRGNETFLGEPPVRDANRADYEPKERKERSTEEPDANAQPPVNDTVYGVASRQRWPSSDGHSLNAETRNAERGEAGSDEEEEEEEEEEGANSLTKAQLKEALDAAEVEYPSSANKAELVELYEANNLGDAE